MLGIAFVFDAERGMHWKVLVLRFTVEYERDEGEGRRRDEVGSDCIGADKADGLEGSSGIVTPYAR